MSETAPAAAWIRLLVQMPGIANALLPRAACDVDAPHARWHSADVTHAAPHTERLWTDVVPADGVSSADVNSSRLRLYLHVIHPPPAGEAAHFHPHGSPTAALVLRGCYTQESGRGEAAPRTMHLERAGDLYTMLHRDDWHALTVPAGEVAYALVIAGDPHVPRREMTAAPGPLRTLARARVADLLSTFSGMLDARGL
jgi:hypothetical protein